jgi:predicted metal-dependent peptidase
MQVMPNLKPNVDKATLQKSLARFATIRVGAAREYPMLGQAIYGMIPVPVPGLAQECGGWAMDKFGRCYFDPEMILGLGETDWPIKTLIADFLHEVWHWARRHPERFENLVVPSGEEKNAVRWNIAADAEINGADRFLRQHLQKFCVFPEKLKDAQGCTLPAHQIAEWYYKMLACDGDDEEDEGGGGGEGPPRCIDEDAPWKLGPPDADTEGLSEKQGETIRKQVAREIQEAARTRGDIPVEWTNWAGGELSPPKIPWQEKVRRFARHSMEVSVGASDFTFRRRSRRQHAVGSSVIIPAVFHPKLKIGVVIDSSGSMSEGDLNTCLSEIDGIARASGGSVFVVSGDTGVGWSGKVSSGRSVSIGRRGGTDMRPLIARVEKENPVVHCTIVLTDGYTPWPDSRENKIPIMVGLVGRHCGEKGVPNWMESIVIDG